MRKEFAEAFLDLALNEKEVCFLTGDLGFMALEKIRDGLKERFMNMGVAEQNMVSVAAGLAYTGWSPWTYSIAPFLVFRPFEQIRNDVALHRLPVRFVGNGGGFGYGIMGSTHHALEDLGVLRTLPGFTLYLPAYAEDVKAAVHRMHQDKGPCYLRLNLAMKGVAPEPFAAVRKIQSGEKLTVVAAGPVAGNVLELAEGRACDVFLISEIPWRNLPGSFFQSLEKTKKLLVLEEHYAAGGVGEGLARELLQSVSFPFEASFLSAQGYPSQRYGSQKWHQEESSLAGEGLRQAILKNFN